MNPNPYFIKDGNELIDKISLEFFHRNNFKYIPIIDKYGIILKLLTLENSIIGKKNDNKKSSEKKVLIIGGAGYIGSVLTRYLLKKKFKVRVFDSLLYGDQSIRNLTRRKDFDFILGDTRNIGLLNQAMENVFAVIHLGEIVGDPACSLDEEYTFSVNFNGTRNVLNASVEKGVSKFIYASSCSVYGFGRSLFTEKSKLNPISFYAKTKVECEKEILRYKNSISVSIMRLATVFGLSYRPRFDLVFNLLCAQAFYEKQINLFGGNQWRPFIHVKDVAVGIERLLRSSHKRIGGQIFNLGSSKLNIQLSALGTLIAGHLNGVNILKSIKKQDNRSYNVDFSKVSNDLNFSTSINFESGIKEILQYFKKNRIDRDSLKYLNNTIALLPESVPE